MRLTSRRHLPPARVGGAGSLESAPALTPVTRETVNVQIDPMLPVPTLTMDHRANPGERPRADDGADRPVRARLRIRPLAPPSGLQLIVGIPFLLTISYLLT